VRLSFEPGTPRASQIASRSPLPPRPIGARFNLRVRQHIDQPFRDVFATSCAFTCLNLSGAIGFFPPHLFVGRLCQRQQDVFTETPTTVHLATLSVSFKILPQSADCLPSGILMTCPLRKFSDSTFPPLKSTTRFSVAAITSSPKFCQSALRRSVCSRLFFHLAIAVLPVATFHTKLSLPVLPAYLSSVDQVHKFIEASAELGTRLSLCRGAERVSANRSRSLSYVSSAFLRLLAADSNISLTRIVRQHGAS